MRRTGIQHKYIPGLFYLAHIRHLQFDPPTPVRLYLQDGFMWTIDRHKPAPAADYAQISGKCNDTTTTVAAHSALPAIGIEIHHFKIKPFAGLKQDEAVSADPKPPVAQTADRSGVGTRQPPVFPLVDHDEIVAGALIFPEMHGCVNF
jgi:hypothetical protein